MDVYVLASGSKGNMTLVETDNSAFFIDAGISVTKMKKKMDDYGIDFRKVEALFITHEHQDHIIGLKGLLKLNTIKQVYLTKGSYEYLSEEIKKLLPEVIFIKSDNDFYHKEVKVFPMMLSHDANEPVGFVFKNNQNKKMVLLTDTGYVHETYHELIENADLYILESNHNPTTLIRSNRPHYLKQRIMNELGHLSNIEAALLMNKVVNNGKKATWVVAHISEDCNSHFDIEEAIVSTFDNPNKVKIYFSSQESLEVIKI